MEMTHRRHDISDEQWALIEGMLPDRRGQWGGVARKYEMRRKGVLAVKIHSNDDLRGFADDFVSDCERPNETGLLPVAVRKRAQRT